MLNYARSLLKDSTVLVAASSLYLYILAISYLDGFLGVFNTEPTWFAPSVFQLLSQTRGGVLVSTILLAGSFGLASTAGMARGWVWRIFAILYTGFCLLIIRHCWMVWGSSPFLASPWQFGFSLLIWYAATPTFLFILSLVFFRVARSFERRTAAAVEQLARSTEDTMHVLHSIVVLCAVLTLPTFCTYFGATDAHRVVVRREAVMRIDPGMQHPTRLIFTDTIRSLVWEEAAVIYSNPEADQKIQVRLVPRALRQHPSSAPSTTQATVSSDR